ncbi:MAG TPA: serine/threonine-protein kinase [Kofleriaceae bacterium]|nr:serine/threonine-protein kinase [Kofleriaceae bacterium]
MSQDDPIGTGPTLTPGQVVAATPTRAETEPPAENKSVRLPDRYVLGSKLGAGGMGEVLLATDRQIGREVAIKRMRVAATPDSVARFMREAKIQGRLEHPAIAPVHELSTDEDGQPFFVMKRLAGVTLTAAGKRFTRQKLLRAFADVCLAVELAHSRGIVHRDLKPDNIMLGDYGEVYVLDWGIARVLGEPDDEPGVVPTARPSDPDLVSDSTAIGSVIGTPGYIAPEVMDGAPADRLADVYALGRILRVIVGDDADAPPELAAIAESASGPHDNRPTARELAERVERYLDGDRDLALRKSLAASHVAAAHAALAAGDGIDQRATAMREAGRAIALDPTHGEAAALVGRLVLEPPRVVPREVEDRLEANHERTAREKSRALALIMITFFAFVPLIMWVGVRSWWMLALFVGSVAIDAANAFRIAYQKKRLGVGELYLATVINAVMIGVMAREFSPVLIAPAIASVSVISFLIDPRIKRGANAVILLFGIMVPWIAEVMGWWSRTMSVEHGALVLESPLMSLHLPQSEIVLATYAVALVALSGYLSNRLASAHEQALRTMEVQAWHLRQLVPR